MTNDPQVLWNHVLLSLSESQPREFFNTWINPLKLKDLDQDHSKITVNLIAPNDFVSNWVNTVYLGAIQKAFEDISKLRAWVKVTPGYIETSSRSPALALEPILELETPKPSPIRKQSTTKPVLGNKTSCVDPRFSFSNFIVGQSNEIAQAATFSVVSNLGRQYNPLVICSPTGMGKSHLLHAVGNRMLEIDSKARVLYFSAETFVNDVIESIQTQKMIAFRKKYRESFDLLLIDDIQILAGKKKCEEEFLHSFNDWMSAGKQVLIASNLAPKLMVNLDDRIRVRLESSLVTDIQIPEIETRMAILKSKADREDIYLPNEVCSYLATHYNTNISELEGGLIRLQAHVSLTSAEITLELAKSLIKSAVPESNPKQLSLVIQAEVAKYFQLKTSDLKSTTRRKPISEARQIAMYLIRESTDLGFREIGELFGGKNHSTVQHACQKIQDLKSRSESGHIMAAILEISAALEKLFK